MHRAPWEIQGEIPAAITPFLPFLPSLHPALPSHALSCLRVRIWRTCASQRRPRAGRGRRGGRRISCSWTRWVASVGLCVGCAAARSLEGGIDWRGEWTERKGNECVKIHVKMIIRNGGAGSSEAASIAGPGHASTPASDPPLLRLVAGSVTASRIQRPLNVIHRHVRT